MGAHLRHDVVLVRYRLTYGRSLRGMWCRAGSSCGNKLNAQFGESHAACHHERWEE